MPGSAFKVNFISHKEKGEVLKVNFQDKVQKTLGQAV